MQREGALHADAVRDAPHGERGAAALSAAPDDDALEQLQPLLLALDHLDVHAYGVAGREPGAVLLELSGLDQSNRVHHDNPFVSFIAGPQPRDVLWLTLPL